jgi:hypothetical protein
MVAPATLDPGLVMVFYWRNPVGGNVNFSRSTHFSLFRRVFFAPFSPCFSPAVATTNIGPRPAYMTQVGVLDSLTRDKFKRSQPPTCSDRNQQIGSESDGMG